MRVGGGLIGCGCCVFRVMKSVSVTDVLKPKPKTTKLSQKMRQRERNTFSFIKTLRRIDGPDHNSGVTITWKRFIPKTEKRVQIKKRKTSKTICSCCRHHW